MFTSELENNLTRLFSFH